jgi:helicase-like protein
VINTGTHRPNLSYHVRPVSSETDKQRHLLDVVREATGSTIVYAATVRHVDALHALFRGEGISATSYHGRQRAQDRGAAQDAFMTGAVPIIIATNAFGMGIDKPDIRTFIHYDLPASLDVYSQESGRAGRDGEPADCMLLFQRSDRGLQLIAYLRDHLSGADMALRVVHRLGSTHEGTEVGTLFRRLSNELEEDRSVVRTLLMQLGASGRSIKRVAGFASGTVLRVTAGGEPGDVSLFRTLEALAVGVQGKRCLWRALQNLRTVPLTVDGMNFVELEAKAVRQWEAIEEHRRVLVPRTFSATDPRTA